MLENLVFPIVLMVIGAALCFVGYRFFLFLLPAWAFVIGFWAGGMGASAAMGGEFLASPSSLLTGLLVGVVLALLSYVFYLFGIFVLAAGLSYWLVTGILLAIGMEPGLLVYGAGLVAAILGVWALFRFHMQKYIIIAITAFAGASTAVIGTTLLTDLTSIADLKFGLLRAIFAQSTIWLLIWAALFVAGIIFQVLTTRGFYLREAGKEK